MFMGGVGWGRGLGRGWSGEGEAVGLGLQSSRKGRRWWGEDRLQRRLLISHILPHSRDTDMRTDELTDSLSSSCRPSDLPLLLSLLAVPLPVAPSIHAAAFQSCRVESSTRAHRSLSELDVTRRTRRQAERGNERSHRASLVAVSLAKAFPG